MAFPLDGTPIVQAFNPPGLSVAPDGDIATIGFAITATGNALLVSIAGAPIIINVNLDLADDEVAIGGPDAGGTRRLGLWVHDPTSNLHRQVGAPGTSQPIRTDKDVDFIGAQAQNVSDNADIAGLNGNTGRIRSITILSIQNLAWEIQYYSADTFRDADPDVDAYLESIKFAEGDGLQDDATGLFRYSVSGLDIPYVDDDASTTLHLSLVNRSAAAKNAGATGEIVVRTTLEESA